MLKSCHYNFKFNLTQNLFHMEGIQADSVFKRNYDMSISDVAFNKPGAQVKFVHCIRRPEILTYSTLFLSSLFSVQNFFPTFHKNVKWEIVVFIAFFFLIYCSSLELYLDLSSYNRNIHILDCRSTYLDIHLIKFTDDSDFPYDLLAGDLSVWLVTLCHATINCRYCFTACFQTSLQSDNEIELESSYKYLGTFTDRFENFIDSHRHNSQWSIAVFSFPTENVLSICKHFSQLKFWISFTRFYCFTCVCLSYLALRGTLVWLLLWATHKFMRVMCWNLFYLQRTDILWLFFHTG